MINRCPWPTDDAQMLAYHDTEWGVPARDDRKHFEFLTLESAQAGLSWRTVLRRREGYRKAFANFDPKKVAAFTAKDEARLLADTGIIRNRQKIRAAIGNARAFLAVQKEFGSFTAYLWGFVKGAPVVNKRRTRAGVPARTGLSDRVSADLKKRDFSFVGSIIVYSHMQAAGLINDHLTTCFRWKELTAAPAKRLRQLPRAERRSSKLRAG